MTREYRTVSHHNLVDEGNERRADKVEHALVIATDKLGQRPEEPYGVYTDVSDLLAHVRHFCDRAGIDYGAVDKHAQTAYEGDVAASGGVVGRDTERFPEVP